MVERHPPIPEFARRTELVEWLRAALHDITVRRIELFCSSPMPERVLCFIDIDARHIHEAFTRLGGQIFGYNALVLIARTRPHFDCPRKSNGTQPTTTQCICRH